MQTVEEFFDKYQIEEFYEKQKEWSKDPIKPFNKTTHRKLSHGVIPGFKNYDLFYERYKSAVEILQERGEVQAGNKILDVGCGEGFFKIFFDSEFEGDLDWYGVDVWKERAEFCRHIGYKKVDEINLENEKLPYLSESFDIVIASHVVEHLPNPDQVLKEFGRVLKKEGILLIATPTKLPLIAELDGLYHKLSRRGLGETQQAFTPGRLEKLTLRALDLPRSSIIDKRGFRIISGRKKLPLENWQWFYKLSKYLGVKMIFFVPEINLIIKK